MSLRPVLLIPALAITIAAAVVVGAGGLPFGSDPLPSSALVLGPPRPAQTFPLSVQPGVRHLRDALGRPFLLHGDTAWSMIADLNREEVDVYLADRRARGFNTLVVSLIEHKFARKAPANIYGEVPFLVPGEFTKPNEAYFAHVDWVLRRAAHNGFLILLAPSYIGWTGGDEGWWNEMVASGPEKLRTYGRFLGNRYRDYDNIVWVHGGDDNPPDKTLVRAIAEGIKETAPRHLHTAHIRRDTPVADFWHRESWLDIISAYTYDPVCPTVRQALADPNRRPVFLMESAYENEHEADEQRVRAQAYRALLCGASGHLFGNNPIWHFGHPGLFPAPRDWWQALGSRGAQSMTHLANLFATLPWWELKPEAENAFLTDGKGEGFLLAAAARTKDRSLAIVYVPEVRSITFDLGQLKGPEIKASWFDPSNGRSVEAKGTPFAANGPHGFQPPGRNAARYGDWVLILQSQPERSGAPTSEISAPHSPSPG